ERAREDDGAERDDDEAPHDRRDARAAPGCDGRRPRRAGLPRGGRRPGLPGGRRGSGGLRRCGGPRIVRGPRGGRGGGGGHVEDGRVVVATGGRQRLRGPGVGRRARVPPALEQLVAERPRVVAAGVVVHQSSSIVTWPAPTSTCS